MRAPAGIGSQHSPDASPSDGMSDDGMNLALRIYRRLAQSFPHEFKLAYGAGNDATRRGRRERNRQKAWNLRASPANHRHRHSRPDRIPERDARRHALWTARADQVARLCAGRHHFDGAWNWADHQRIQHEMACCYFARLPAAANAEGWCCFRRRRMAISLPVSYYYVEQFREQKSLFTGVAAFKTGVPFNVTFRKRI